MPTIAERMHVLFRGHTGGHGTYGQEERLPGRAKAEIKKSARTLREGPSPDLWQQHLTGTRPLGVIPIDSNGECYWGVIDIDKYDLTHSELVRRAEHYGLPLVICKSKSGGAHMFVFLAEPIDAETLITKLREWAAVMGHGNSEIFPKQIEVREDRGDLGNWLNMPYFDMERGERYAVFEDGRGMSVTQFLNHAENSRVSADRFRATTAGSPSDDVDLADGPPCLQYLGGTGVSEGGRNNALFAFGVLAKKKFPDAWEPKLEEWNRKFLNPPLASDEILLVIKSLRRKEYNYRCKDTPLVSHCDARTCRTRKYGVGVDSSPGIVSIAILDTSPPLFFVTLNSGGTIECTTDDLLSSRSFQRAALEQMRVLLPMFKQETWQFRVQECLDNAVIIEAPHEVSDDGAFRELLQEFCTDRHAAQEKDEILLGKPWFNDEDSRYYFRLADLLGHLERAKFRGMTRNKAVTRIRDLNGKHMFFNLRGRGVNVWHLPSSAFDVQTEPHDTPRVQEFPL
jgi:hypothetical protein